MPPLSLKDKISLFRKEEEEIRAFPEIRIKTWDFKSLSKVKELKSYYVGKFSRIIIGELEDPPRRMYIVIDPPVSANELKEIEKIAGEFVYVIEGVPDEKRLIKLMEDKNIKRRELQYLLIRELANDRFGPLDPLMQDPSLENIECTGPLRPLTVVHNEFGRLETNLIFNEEELDKLVMKLANKAGKSISKANPRIDNARLPGGHRLACTFMSEISESSSFVIRKFPSEPWTITKHMVYGTLTPEIGAWLWLLIEHKLPILVVGGMGTGKTSLVNSLCGFIPPDKRLGTVEDVPEFNLPVKQHNWQRMFTRESFTLDGKGQVSLFDLVKEMLRFQVEYLIVNEIRGEEAKVWFQQISSGHGGITTIHADDFESALARLKDLGIDVASLSSLCGLVYIGVYSPKGKRARRLREVADFEIVDGRPTFRTLFTYDPTTDSYRVTPPELLARTRSAKKIMSFSERYLLRNEEDFVREYQKRVVFLSWLRDKAVKDPTFLKPSVVVNEFEKFYRQPDYFREETGFSSEKSLRVVGMRKASVREMPVVKAKKKVSIDDISVSTVGKKRNKKFKIF